MTLDQVAQKVIPPLLVAMIITLSGVVITVYIMKSTQDEVIRQNIKQWEYISSLTESTIRNDERIKAIKEKNVNP